MILAVVAVISLLILFYYAIRLLIIHVERTRPVCPKPIPKLSRFDILAAQTKQRKNKQ